MSARIASTSRPVASVHNRKARSIRTPPPPRPVRSDPGPCVWVVWVVTSAPIRSRAYRGGASLGPTPAVALPTATARSSRSDLVELGEGLLLQRARQRREVDVLRDRLPVGQHVLDESLDQRGLLRVIVLRLDQHVGRRGDRVGRLTIHVDRAVGEVVRDLGAFDRGGGTLERRRHVLASLVLDGGE